MATTQSFVKLFILNCIPFLPQTVKAELNWEWVWWTQWKLLHAWPETLCAPGRHNRVQKKEPVHQSQEDWPELWDEVSTFCCLAERVEHSRVWKAEKLRVPHSSTPFHLMRGTERNPECYPHVCVAVRQPGNYGSLAEHASPGPACGVALVFSCSFLFWHGFLRKKRVQWKRLQVHRHPRRLGHRGLATGRDWCDHFRAWFSWLNLFRLFAIVNCKPPPPCLSPDSESEV